MVQIDLSKNALQAERRFLTRGGIRGQWDEELTEVTVINTKINTNPRLHLLFGAVRPA